MLGMLDTTRSVNFSAQLMKYHDTVMESAINQLGRVA
jgi:hypothetical protein